MTTGAGGVSTKGWFRVRLELKRIQTWLFAVDKLRTIVGANVLLGEFLRITCPSEAAKFGACADKLAEGLLKRKDERDPLQGAAWEADDPLHCYGKGILARDGGHFRALFDNLEKAQSCRAGLVDLVTHRLPGLPFEIAVEEWRDGSAAAWKEIDSPSDMAVAMLQPSFLPVCELSGEGFATAAVKQAGKTYRVGSNVKAQWSAGGRFIRTSRERRTHSRDLVSLLEASRAFPPDDTLPPVDFESLAEGGAKYLALIHADGNGIGKRSAGEKPQGNPQFPDWLAAEARREVFFHNMRVVVRRSLKDALQKAFGNIGLQAGDTRPYQILMLGGDDLLLVCRAEFALRFVVEMARQLADEHRKIDEAGTLGVGFGVAIAPPNLPFHRLHELAEELAASAKRYARRAGAPTGESVVDWQVTSASLVSGVDDHRRRFDMLRYLRPGNGGALLQLALTAKPYPVLKQNDSAWSLERLLELADSLNANGGAARSQMKSLPDELRRGFQAGRFAALDLPGDLCQTLRNQLGAGDAFPWETIEGGPAGIERYRTLVADLFEIAEIPSMGRTP